MPFELTTFLLALGLLAGMLLALEAGRRIGVRRRELAAERGASVAAIEGAVFALFGLLIAFTFSGAASRFDTRRELIVTEANAIGTAYLRIDLLPAEAQPPLRTLFRTYLQSRIDTYRKLPDLDAALAEYQRSVALQGEIWTQAVAAAKSTGSPAVLSLVVPSLNDMIDITTTRLAASRTHLPQVILVLLFALALAASLVAGFSTAADARRSWLHNGLFAFVIAASIFVIIDLEYPRLGLIRVDAADRLLLEVLEGMK
jgi:hypothetical protein